MRAGFHFSTSGRDFKKGIYSDINVQGNLDYLHKSMRFLSKL
ncbi:hypothetical protein VIBHAR_05453 [Vibrio campbellii ATCC BAA-1116]|uniref:Uncharacterized protein n=1 Tax=Vibrio campbellii (strain ATCC BAA-1116) TaxID=2902295 RepID=A7N3R5_VIBC1|nr:hypothetical protein VIBHAR_05453 [Vibrio campbellii ATCC BAA-1116]